MAKKKKTVKRQPTMPKVDPTAISIRTGSPGRTTILLDDSFLPDLSSAKYDVVDVAFRRSPKKRYEQLCEWTGQGKWFGIASDPEILDSDGVPDLDIVPAKSPPSDAPKKGFWFDPLTRFLDVPSGKLRVVYDEQFLQADGCGLDELEFEINSPADERMNDEQYAESGSYLISLSPGFYQATIFTRLFDSDYPAKEDFPDLAVYLSPCARPKRFKPDDPIVPIHPPDQDVYGLRRQAAGLPPVNQETFQHKPKLLKGGDFRGKLMNHELFGLVLEMPESMQKKFGYQQGRLVTIEFENPNRQMLLAVLTESQGIDPTAWDAIEKIKRKSTNFAIVESYGSLLHINQLKKSRKDPFGLPDGEMVVATMKAIQSDDASGKPSTIATHQSAVKHRNAVEIPKRGGQPGTRVKELFPLMKVCQAWTQACLFEIDGRLMIGAVQVFPPQHLINRLGKEVTMAAEISASVGTVKDGVTVDETPKEFRGYPGGVERALKWVAGYAKGGWLWTNRFELQIETQYGKKVDKKAAKRAAINAWHEVLGIDA